MDYFSKIIYDDPWNFYLVSEGDNTIADENSEAETDIEKREVYFRRSGVTLLTVRHEMFHLVFSYSFSDTANLDSLQTEEMCAEMFAYQGQKILKLSDEVYLQLLQLRDKK